MLDFEMNALPWGTFRPGLTVRALIGLSRHTLLGRGKLRKQLARLLFLLHAGPVDCWLWGHRIRLFPDHNVCERKALLRPDRMDRQEYGFLRTQLARARSVFVDVGANAGLYSLYAALNAGAGARILAIEPDAALLARFTFNLRLARVARYAAPDIEVTTVPVAVGEHDGEALLSTSGDEGSRSLRGSGVGRPVQVRRLAALLADHAVGKITVLKIDVEGYEDRVLPPYLAEVPQEHWPDAIIIEHVYRPSWSVDCIKLCQGHGYRISGITNNNTLLARGA
jgi:FkbM family methyltransferase